MKKTFTAMAALAAAGAASAQSVVMLYGIVDVSLTRGIGSINSRNAVNGSGLGASHWGVRGVEDLGGGLAAGFSLESQFLPDSGLGAASNINNQIGGISGSSPGMAPPAPSGTQGVLFNRRSTVSLMGRFGELRVGRDYTPHFYNNSRFDPFTILGVGASVQQLGHGASESAGQITSVANPTNTRASNSIGYLLPGKLGGFYGQAMYYVGENPSSAANPDDGRGTSVRLGYANGPVDVAAAWGKTQYATTAITGDVTTVNIGAAYDFGVARLTAAWGRDNIKAATEIDFVGYVIGVHAPVGPGSVRAALSQTTLEAAGAATDPRVRKLALGYVLNLSKRTALYATIARVRNSGGAAHALNGTTTAANESSSGLDIGLRHSF